MNWSQIHNFLRGNVYVVLIQRLLVAMLLFSLCRLCFYLFNTAYFSNLSASRFIIIFIGGLRFDLTAVLYINALFILLMIAPLDLRFTSSYQKLIKYLFLFTNAIGILMNLADSVYYPFTLRRTTADVFRQFENEANIGPLILRFVIDYWYVLIPLLLLIALMNYLYNLSGTIERKIRNNWVYYLSGFVAIPFVTYLFAAGARGGFAHSIRPITLSNAGAYVKDPREINLVLNTPFSLFRTIGKTKIQRVSWFQSDEELEATYSPMQLNQDSVEFRPDNVVIIILESFSKEFIGALTSDQPGYKGYTPFLDSLLEHSLRFDYSFANGRKSIDGLPSVVASLPSMGVPYVLSPFSGNRINGLGSLLAEKGYHTSFFHGAPNGSMGFDAFVNVTGFDHYVGMDEYVSEIENGDEYYDGMWGIWDEHFMKYYAEKMREFPQPFVSVFFSVSSHHPFKIPAEYKEMFKGGEQPILKCIQYTDYSLRKFFDRVRVMPGFENTLFVITADHCSSDILFDETRTAWGLYAVPILFYKPDNSLAQRKRTIAQHADIMPSVLGYLRYDKPFIAFGRNVFDSLSTPFAFNYNNAYQLFENSHLLQFNGTESIALYNFADDKFLKDNKKDVDTLRAKEMEKKLKAIIQQYNNRLIDNRLTVNPGR